MRKKLSVWFLVFYGKSDAPNKRPLLPSACAQRRPYVETILNRQQKELLETFIERVAI